MNSPPLTRSRSTTNQLNTPANTEIRLQAIETQLDLVGHSIKEWVENQAQCEEIFNRFSTEVATTIAHARNNIGNTVSHPNTPSKSRIKARIA